ncbi:response regulator transcription factor [Ensifer sp. BR816]|uniref:winged helix-turn-helix transcriptional regulator n=1 Tax=Rhizobium sp. (strain BR816) TaxID=1057002 RepID=UPI0009FF8CAF|nr:response regulator transcription factor [Ensifer sp. BR816]
MRHEIRYKIVLGGEIDYVNLLKHIVENEGITAIVARNPEEVVMLAETEKPNLIVLSDFGSHMSAMLARDEVFISIRKCSAPVLVLLTAQGAEVHADKTECLVKPFSPAEFVARLRRLLRPPREGRSNVLGFADIVMDLDAYRVYRHRRCIHLSPIEYRLLRHLLASPRRVFARGELLAAAWDRNVHVELRTIDVHMSRLRKALSRFGEPNYIRTVRSAGYSLDTEDVEAAIG